MARPTCISDVLAKPLWQAERLHLRDVLLGCGLTETLKWGGLCFTHNNGNLAMIYALKDYIGVGFFRGALLADPDGHLHAQGENSQAVRLMRFTSIAEMDAQTPVLQEFVAAAKDISDQGLKVDFKQRHDLDYPSELVDKMGADPIFAHAFEALTPGRQRGYILFISSAKATATRHARVIKHTDRILAGKGIHDCVCGLSARMPRCDGSHKKLN